MIENITERLESVLETVPDYYHESSVYQNLILTYLIESQASDEARQDLQNQLYVQTATWGLDYWEHDYALTSIPGDTYELRRSRILSKMAGLGTFTKAEALRLANVYSIPKDARFYSILNEGAFKTRHNIDHLVDYEGMIEAFEEMKPAHLEHLVGLLIRHDSGPTMSTGQKMRIGYSENYNFTYRTLMKLKVRATVVIPGKYQADPPDSLALDGSFRMDGYAFMDAKAPGGKLHYIHNSDQLVIRTYQDGQLISTDRV